MLCHLRSSFSASSLFATCCYHTGRSKPLSLAVSSAHIHSRPRHVRNLTCCNTHGRRTTEGHVGYVEHRQNRRSRPSHRFCSSSFRPVKLDGKHSVNLASRSKLDNVDVSVLFGGSTLRDALGRAACDAGCLPRKEFFEAWEVGRRVHEHFRTFMTTGTATSGEDFTVVDLAAGHGMLAWVLLALEPRLPFALCIDKRKPVSAGKLEVALVRAFPRLAGRLRYAEGDMAALRPHSRTLLVSVHACGALTDTVLDLAVRGRAPVAVVPCCHVLDAENASGLHGWIDGSLAMDLERAARLKAAGYAIDTQLIPEEVTPKNRLLLGLPKVTEPPYVGGLSSKVQGMEDTVMNEIGTVHESSLHSPIWSLKSLPDSPWTKFRTHSSTCD